MSKAATDDNRFTGRNGSAEPHLVPPVKIRRRPGHIVATIAATLVGAAIAAWAWLGTTSSEQVIVARTTIHQGDVIICRGPDHDPDLARRRCPGRRW